jgi:hypothetical protein
MSKNIIIYFKENFFNLIFNFNYFYNKFIFNNLNNIEKIKFKLLKNLKNLKYILNLKNIINNKIEINNELLKILIYNFKLIKKFLKLNLIYYENEEILFEFLNFKIFLNNLNIINIIENKKIKINF